MAPSGRTRASRPKTARKARRTIFKKPVVVKPKQKIQKTPPPPNSPSKSSSLISGGLPQTESIDFEAVVHHDVSATSSPCSTPKAQRYRIPQIVSCPPAPKKQRVNSNCLFRRSPIAFFAPPDLELFFYFANRGISV
ncbi:cyclin-dependent protein kinase inhibitor SMR9 [Rosa sericea]|uniref:Uncharacterized protein n=1 Tax=Rosa chinensis TaxID=74649 RepID=A0A2P6QFJ9_ROSCH|nr:cyclin-dependent protein kinase inhibitor SMR9 [Rosa chinensis]PRQ32963.1 hypothetical protein RchiOBHm_Chr5g0052211 [Rosa chinensis]